MATYDSIRAILAELDRVLGRVDEAEVDAFCSAILGARRIVAYAMGRENLALRSFVMRLMHLGLDVAMVGDITAPPVGQGDLFLVVCGPGYISTTAGLIGVARHAGAQIVIITAQPQAELPRQADLVLTIPAQTLADSEQSSSGQAMGSAFEQGLWILLDALVPRLQAALGQSAHDLRARHANLE
ncbi:MAG: 6-phospho-3-hexuloisomerase [Kouleothrix sp.]|jgi:6-phospho-3-hexuloisomerase|nr:SIS domain-containing protein [Kouleothrix sp.]